MYIINPKTFTGENLVFKWESIFSSQVSKRFVHAVHIGITKQTDTYRQFMVFNQNFNGDTVNEHVHFVMSKEGTEVLTLSTEEKNFDSYRPTFLVLVNAKKEESERYSKEGPNLPRKPLESI